jgi:WD40 repeat protein
MAASRGAFASSLFAQDHCRTVRCIYARRCGMAGAQRGVARSASSSAGLRIRLWGMPRMHEGCVNVVRFCHAGNLVASGSDDCNLVLWGLCRPGDRRRVIGCPLSATLRSSLGSDGLVPATDESSPLEPLARFHTGHTGNMFGIGFLRCSRVMTGAADGEVRLLDVSAPSDNRLLRVWSDHKGMVHEVRRLSDSVGLSAAGDGTVRLRDERDPSCVGNRSIVMQWPEGGLTCLSVHPADAMLVAAAGAGRLVRVFDLRVGAALDASCASMSHGVTAVSRLYSMRRCICGLETPQPQSGQGRVTGISWSVRGDMIAATSSKSHVSVFRTPDAWQSSSALSLPSLGLAAAEPAGTADDATDSSQPACLRRGSGLFTHGSSSQAGVLSTWSRAATPTDSSAPSPHEGGCAEAAEASATAHGRPVSFGGYRSLSTWNMHWMAEQQSELDSLAGQLGLAEIAMVEDSATDHQPSTPVAVSSNEAAAPAGSGLARMVRAVFGRSRASQRTTGEAGVRNGEANTIAPRRREAEHRHALIGSRRKVFAAAAGVDRVRSSPPWLPPLRGARNSRTVKEVSFLGPDSDVVVAGSDCGHMLAWHLDAVSASGRPLRAWKADSRIVNVVEAVPESVRASFGCGCPLTSGWGLLSSGIDNDVKCWDLRGRAALAGAETDREPHQGIDAAGGPAVVSLSSATAASATSAGHGKVATHLPRDPEWAVAAAETAELAKEGASEPVRREAMAAALQVFADPRSHPMPDSPHGPCGTRGETWPLFPHSSRPGVRLLGPAGPAAVFASAAYDGLRKALSDLRAPAHRNSDGEPASRDYGWEERDSDTHAPMGHACTPAEFRLVVSRNESTTLGLPTRDRVSSDFVTALRFLALRAQMRSNT